MALASIDFRTMLVPPEYCTATGGLTMRDKRKGAIWYCAFSRKIIGKGRKQPPCLCKKALTPANPLQPK